MFGSSDSHKIFILSNQFLEQLYANYGSNNYKHEKAISRNSGHNENCAHFIMQEIYIFKIYLKSSNIANLLLKIN